MAGAPLYVRRFRPAPLLLTSGRRLPLDQRVVVMGAVNVTPDSFYAASRSPHPEEAVAAALQLVAEGALIVDVGGESTRPGSEPVSEKDEMERVLPVIEGIRKRSHAVLSVDTRKAAVARAALAAGADIVNDVSGLKADPAMASVVAASGAVVVLVHARGTPKTMQQEATYEDVVLQVKAELGARIAEATRRGIPSDRIWIDPGIGFAKSLRHNLEILQRLDELLVFEKPLLVGLSRKSFLGRVLGEDDPAGRLEGSLAAAAIAALQGAHVVRTHDVAATLRAVRVAEAVLDPARAGD